jgi:lipoprotein YgeR
VKDLARMNNIPAPYTIEVGQKLKVNGSSSSSAKNPRRQKRKPPK